MSPTDVAANGEVELVTTTEPPPYRRTFTENLRPRYDAAQGDNLKPTLPQLIPFPDVSPAAPLLHADHPLPSYWLATSSATSKSSGVNHLVRPNLDDQWEEDVDVAIIGSGITGISAAYHLVNKLPVSIKNVALFEARELYSGATDRNEGHLTASSVLSYANLTTDPAYLFRFLEPERVEHWGNDRGAKMDETVRTTLTLEAGNVAELIMIIRMKIMRARKTNQSLHEDPELVFGSNWHFCGTQAELDATKYSVESAKRAGLSDYALQICRVPETEWKGKLHQPNGVVGVYEIPGGTIHPRRFVNFLWILAYSKATAKNVKLKTWTFAPIYSLESSEDGGSSILHTKKGKCRARYVVHAINAYVSHLLPAQFSGDDNERRVVPTRRQCIAPRPTRSSEVSEPLWNMGFSLTHGYDYLQQRPTDLISTHGQAVTLCILGRGRQFSRGYEWNVAGDSSIDRNVSASLRPILSSTFPNNFSEGADPDFEWTGIMAFTKTCHPWVGTVSELSTPSSTASSYMRRPLRSQYVSDGYSGHGMSRAFSCAQVVVDVIVSGEVGKQWKPLSWFPQAFLTFTPEMRSEQHMKVPIPSNGGRSKDRRRYCLMAAGSNGAGQLALGVDNTKDSHNWAPCQGFADAQEGIAAFPPEGWVIEDMCGGANHTVALLRSTLRQTSDQSKYPPRQVWLAGDSTLGQRGPLPRRLADDHSAACSTVFVPLDLRSMLSSRQPRLSSYSSQSSQPLPAAIAATWSNTFIVVSPASEANDDDQVWCLGGEGDFGQLGMDSAWTNTKPTPPSPHLVKVRSPIDTYLHQIAHLENGRDRLAGSASSRLTVVAMAAGVRHVIALVHCPSGDSDGRVFLLGWGAARHGQLQWDDPLVYKPSKVEWTPTVVCSWSTQGETPTAANVRLAAGKDHSAVMVPAQWSLDRAAKRHGSRNPASRNPVSRVHILGSNRAGQLDVMEAVARADGVPRWVGATWNSTFVAMSHGTDSSDDSKAAPATITSMIASGKNDKGQLGCDSSRPRASSLHVDLSEVLRLTSRPSTPSNKLSAKTEEIQVEQVVCGSEHVLALVSTLEDRQDGRNGKATEVWGWGWNEHGNLALGHLCGDAKIPVQIWKADGVHRDARAVKVWAGCATSFLLLEVPPK